MRTYGSSFSLVEDETRLLVAAQKHLLALQSEIHAGGEPVSEALVASALTLDQLFAAFGQVLRRSGEGEVLGTSSAGEWVNPKPLLDALAPGLSVGSWYAYSTELFDHVILIQEGHGQNRTSEHFYEVGVVDPDQGPYFTYPNGTPAPDPGKGDRLDQQTRMMRHWFFSRKISPCRVTSLNPLEARSFLEDTLASC